MSLKCSFKLESDPNNQPRKRITPYLNARAVALASMAFNLSLTAGALSTWNASAQSMPPHSQTVETSDVRLQLAATANGPLLLTLSSPANHAGGSRDSKEISAWNNRASEAMPPYAEISGKKVRLSWRLMDQNPNPATGPSTIQVVTFVYECPSPHLRLSWIWQARATFGPIEHYTAIENLGSAEVWLPMIDSLDLEITVPSHQTLHHFYVEKGADTPSNEGIHSRPVPLGYRWQGLSSTYARPVRGEDREIIPAEFIFDNSETKPSSNAESIRTSSVPGWFAGIEFSGRTRISLERRSDDPRDSGQGSDLLVSRLGLNPEPGPYLTRLPSGAVYKTPTIFLGAFRGGPDDAGNQLKPWVRAVLGNQAAWKDPQYPLTVNNSWGSGLEVDEALALRMIGQSKELGLEMFHLDAGWFRAVGDWYPDPKKFPHGLSFVADEAHRQGLRFGLWTDWTQAALSTNPGALNVQNPVVRDWMVHDVGPDWHPEPFKGQTIDIGVPEARDYASKEIKRIVESYHLDMLEHDGYLVAKGCVRQDHPHAAPVLSTVHVTHDWGSDFILASNSTDVSDHAVRAYYDLYERLRHDHPGLLLEICNDGGRMVDFGSAAHGDYFSITDTYDPLSNRRAFYDASYLLPPAMLESYIEKWPTDTPQKFLYMLRSGMMGWMTIMLDTTAWTEQQNEAARHEITLYKQQLRALIRDSNVYHVSARPDGIHWDGIEYTTPASGKGVVFAFRGSVPDQPEHTFKLSGLNAADRYRLHFEDGTSPDQLFSGAELMQTGLTVNLASPFSSELIFLERENSSGKH